MYVCILSHDGEIVLHRHMKAAPEAFLQAIALYRGGRLPQADVYPAERRATRDLLRRRTHLMRKCSELLSHVQHTNSQYNLPEIGKKIAYKANRQGVAERFDEAAVQKTIEVDLALIT